MSVELGFASIHTFLDAVDLSSHKPPSVLSTPPQTHGFCRGMSLPHDITLKLHLFTGSEGTQPTSHHPPQTRRVPLRKILDQQSKVCYDLLVKVAIAYALPQIPLDRYVEYQVSTSYQDIDNDRVTIATTEELEDAMVLFSKTQGHTLRLKTIVEPKRRRSTEVRQRIISVVDAQNVHDDDGLMPRQSFTSPTTSEAMNETTTIFQTNCDKEAAVSTSTDLTNGESSVTRKPSSASAIKESKTLTKEEALLLLGPDDLDDFQINAGRLRRAISSTKKAVVVEQEVVVKMRDLCCSNRQRVRQAWQVASKFNQLVYLEKLQSLDDCISKYVAKAGDALTAGEFKPCETDQKPHAASKTMETIIANMEIFCLLMMLHAQDDSRFDAACALMNFARDPNVYSDDHGRTFCLRDEISSCGGLLSLLRVLQAIDISYELKVVVALTLSYILASSSTTVSISIPQALKVVDCLDFLNSARPISLNAKNIKEGDLRVAAAEGTGAFWICVLQPLLDANDSLDTQPIMDSNSESTNLYDCSFQQHLTSLQMELVIEKTVSVVISMAKSKYVKSDDEENINAYRLCQLRCCTLVEQLCSGEKTQLVGVRQGILNALIDWIKSDDCEEQKVALLALRELSRIKEPYNAGWVRSQMATTDVLDGLAHVVLFRSVGLGIRPVVAEILCDLCRDPQSRMAVAAQSNCIKCLTALLCDHEDDDESSVQIAYQACEALINLAAWVVNGRIVGAGCSQENNVLRVSGEPNDVIKEIIQQGALGPITRMCRTKRGWKYRFVAIRGLHVLSEDKSRNNETRHQLLFCGAAHELSHVINEYVTYIEQTVGSTVTFSRDADELSSSEYIMDSLYHAVLALSNIIGPCDLPPTLIDKVSSEALDGILEQICFFRPLDTRCLLCLDASTIWLSENQLTKVKAFLAEQSRITVNGRFQSDTIDKPSICDNCATRSSFQHDPLNNFIEGSSLAVLSSAPILYEYESGKYRTMAQRDIEIERGMVYRSLTETNPYINVWFDTATRLRLVNSVTMNCTYLHFSGHGFPHYLTLEDTGRADLIDPANFAKLLKIPFRFVFVSAIHPEAAVAGFLKAGVPHVVSCQQDPDLNSVAADVFIREFYTMIARGSTVNDSFKRGCQSTIPYLCDDLERFRLLPIEGDHHVSLFKAASSSASCAACRSARNRLELVKRNMLQELPCPAPPKYFLGREVDMFKVLRAILHMRLASVIGAPGSGRSTLICALCQFINQRRSTLGTVIERIYFVKPKQQCGVSCFEVIAQLRDKLIRLGKKSPKFDTDVSAAICECLKREKALIVFDHTEALDGSKHTDEFRDFLGLLISETRNVRVLLSANQTGTPLRGQVEKSIQLGPLDFVSSCHLFARWCPHLCTREERNEFGRHLAAIRDKGRHARDVDARSQKTVTVLDIGLPASVKMRAQSISKEAFLKLGMIVLPHEIQGRFLGST